MENRKSQKVRQDSDTKKDVKVWALPEGAIARFGRGRVTDMAFAPNGNTLAVGSCLGVGSTMYPP